MSVKVIGPSEDNDHERGTWVRVSDAHLLVEAPGNDIVAIYAPGHWQSAHVSK